MSEPISQASIHNAILQALKDDPLPPEKRGALIVHGDWNPQTNETTLTAVMAEKVGDHWTLSEDVELHDAQWGVGVAVVASWP